MSVLQIEVREARSEANMLLGRALGDVSRAWLITHEGDSPAQDQLSTFHALLERRLDGEPIAYILGEREFYGLSFKVTPATLIPRPETELLVELALERIAPDASCRILDLGAGSGAIALAVAHARPKVQVIAVDASAAALDVARENAVRLGIANATFRHGDWYAPLAEERFALIVSNPPYIAAGDPHLSRGDLRFEPPSALASGADGLDDIRRIAAGARAHLAPGGWLLLEHGYDQGAPVREILRRKGLQEVFTAPDLAGIDRVSGARVA